MTTLLKIGGMTCQNCARHVREALEKLPGVKSVEVDLSAGQAKVQGDAPQVGAMVEAVQRAGYTASAAA